MPIFMKNLKNLFILCFIISMTFLSSCESELHHIEVDANGDIIFTPFEFSESDDAPLNYNMTMGGNIQYSNGFIFFTNFRGSAPVTMDGLRLVENKTLHRWNVRTNNMTTVCPDPLCGHNIRSCPFFAMDSEIYLYNNKILFLYRYTLILERPNARGERSESGAGFRLHNTSTGRSYVRSGFDPAVYINHRKLFIGNYVLYYDYIYNEEIGEWVFAINRWNLLTNDIVVIAGMNNVFDFGAVHSHLMASNFLFSIDSRIYFTDGRIIYSTDINYGNRIDHIEGNFLLDVKTNGQYIFYGVPIEDGSFVQSIHRINFDGTNNMELGIFTRGRWEITENYIYYLKYDEIAIGRQELTGWIGGEYLILHESEVWRSNHDGNNHELVFRFEGDLAYHRIRDEIFAGNYIYAFYEYWVDSSEDGVFRDRDHRQSWSGEYFSIMRINVETGEVFFIRIPN